MPLSPGLQGLGLTRNGGSLLATITPFAFQAETTTLATAISPTANRKLWIDRTIRRLKSSGIWAKARWINLIGADENAWLTNWVTPAEKMTKNGTPTFVADTHAFGAAGVNCYTLPFNADALSQNNVGVYVWAQTASMGGTAIASGSCIGAINAGATGFSLAPNSSSNNITTRLSGAIVTAAASTSDGFGLIGGSRSDSANITQMYNGVALAAVANASAALPALPMIVCGLNNNTTINGVTTPLSATYFGQALTAAEASTLTAIIGEYLEAILFGDYYFEEPGYGTATITKQCLVYGLTGQGVAAAVAIARQGKTVAICGGWRDRFSFGLSGGGLGYTDFDTATALGGLPRWAITDMNTRQGFSDTPVGNNPAEFKFMCKDFNRTMKKLLKTYNIPVYLTNGVTTVNMTGTAATSCKTTDGRTFNFVQWHDGSYEQDFADRVPAIGLFKGREAAGSGGEANNGVQAITTCQFPTNHAGTEVVVDPWITAGDKNSGLLPSINFIFSTPDPSIHNYPTTGSADTRIPAYNFRLTMTNNALYRIALPSSAPTGFSATNYELLIRHIDAANLSGSPLVLADLLKMDELRSTGRYDVNNGAGVLFSTDMITGSDAYPTASYPNREVIWKAHWNYTLGFWYVLQYHVDARIPATLRTEARTWGFCNDHYYSPHENDLAFQSPQIYARETQRLVGSVIMNATHMTQADGATPTLGDHTVSCASYSMDSHSTQRVVHENPAGTYRTKDEGGMFVAAGGVNKISPLPFEIFVPKVAECNNGSVSFGGSLTHASYGSSRMEFTAMQTAYSMGLAHALAIDGDGIIQNVSYATLRTALLASPALSGEVAPVLPQLT